MTHVQRIKAAYEGALEAIGKDFAAGRGTAVTTVRVRDGLTCDIEDGAWKLVGDEMEGDGGNGLGPDPGVFGRAALGSCLAIGYMTLAAVRGVPVAALEVVVEADYDAAGMLGLDPNAPPGWTAVRYTVHVESDAPESDVLAVIDEADRHSSILYGFTHPLSVTCEVKLSAPAR
jgi:uncharacterized OsmC-like protein